MAKGLSDLPAWLLAVLLCLGVGAVAVQLGSGLPLAAEQSALSALEFCLLAGLGLACMGLAITRPRSAFHRAAWIFAGIAMLVIAAVEASMFLGLYSLAEQEDDYGNLLTWALTAFALYLITRFDRPPPRAEKFLYVGFALQSAALFADLGDGGIFDVPQVQAMLMGELDEIFDLLFLIAYCAGFFLFVRHALAGALSAAGTAGTAVSHGRAADADHTEPALFIRRRYRQMRWHRGRLTKRLGIAFQMVAWPLLLPVLAAWFTWRNGQVVARRSGRPVHRQFLDQCRIGLQHGIAPYHYYAFEMFDAGRLARAGEYLFRHETKGFAYALLRRRPITPLTDKLAFAARCQAHGVAVIPVLLALDGKGQFFVPARGLPRLPEHDLFIKPNPGKGGRGAERWDYLGEGRYGHGTGRVLTAAQLIRRLARKPFDRGCVVQPRMTNHPALADLSNGALTTVRIVTCRNEAGTFEATNAVFRMARGRNTTVDNFHAGGIAARVDLRTGELGPATDLGMDAALGWLDRHPDTGAPITGRKLPLWRETLELARQAHRSFPDRAIIGWDIGILADGPVLVEGNSSPDLDIIQRTHRTPIGNARLGRLLAFLLREALQGRAQRDRAAAGRGLADAAR